MYEKQPTHNDITSAKLALVVAWMAQVGASRVCEAPTYIFEDRALDLEQAAAFLASREPPLTITPAETQDGLQITLTPLMPESDHLAYQPLTTGPDTEERILVVAGRCRLRVAPQHVEAASRNFSVAAPSGSVADLIDSAFADSLGLLPEEGRGIAEILVLGRTTESGWEMPIVPSRQL